MEESTNKGGMKRWFTTRQASEYTGIPESTLRWFRSTNQGPIYTKPKGRCVYDVADLDSFMESGLRFPARATQETKRNVAV